LQRIGPPSSPPTNLRLSRRIKQQIAALVQNRVTEKAKDVADTVNKKVGQGLASAIDKGENVTQSAKEAVGLAADTTKEKSKKAADLAKQKGNQAAVGAREAKEDFKKEVKK